MAFYISITIHRHSQFFYDMKVLYSGFIDPSHSSFGGYHKIIDFPSNKKTLLAQDYLFGTLDKKYRLKRIPNWLLDFDTRIRRHNYDITHLFYGEITMIPFLPYTKSDRHKTVITLHLDITKQKFHKSFLKSLPSFDGIIVLSTQQQEYYRDKWGIETTFIPHGFDKPEYIFNLPKDINGKYIDPDKINLITSGKNYRDFETLKKIVNRFESDCRFNFHLVGTPGDIKANLANKENVRIYPRINDDEYYSLIRSCDYGFLPVTFATANNALLETQALGIKSILPHIPGILDYASESNIFYNSYENLVDIISNLNKSSVSEDILKHAEKFHWNNIFIELEKFYTQILSK